MTRVFITGLGAITPIGNDAPTFWKNLTAGVSGAGPITAFDSTDFPIHICCAVKDFDPGLWMDHKMARRTARVTQFALAAARQALADADLSIDPNDSENVGVVIATGGGGMTLLEEGTLVLIEKGPRSVSPLLLPSLMPNAVSSLVSIETRQETALGIRLGSSKGLTLRGPFSISTCVPSSSKVIPPPPVAMTTPTFSLSSGLMDRSASASACRAAASENCVTRAVRRAILWSIHRPGSKSFTSQAI